MWPAPERNIWGPRTGILAPTELRRAVGEHPAWRLTGRRLVRDLHFKDFREAFGFVEHLATEVEDFGRHPDICLLDGNRVRVAIGNPHHAGVTVSDLRLIERVDATAERYLAERTRPVAAAQPAPVADAHEHPLHA